MAQSKPFPEIPPGLLQRLEEAFPDQVLRDPDATPEKWYRQQGQQQVMDLLRTKFTKQERIHVLTKGTQV